MRIHSKHVTGMGLPLVVLLGCIGPTDQTFPEGGQTLPGAVQISVTTTGDNIDSDGYQVTIDESMSEPVGVNGSVTFSPLQPGNYQVVLSEVASNCAIDGGATRPFVVQAGATTGVAYSVACS
jgi:hypothetical protein